MKPNIVIDHNEKVWCGWCQAYVFRASADVHFAMHARRLERSGGPETEEAEA